MAVIIRVESDAKLKLKGTLTTGYDGISFDKNGNLSVLEVHTKEPGFNDTDMVDDTRQLDDAYQFDDSLGVENFLSYIFGLTPTDININYFSIDNKKLLLSEVLENQIL